MAKIKITNGSHVVNLTLPDDTINQNVAGLIKLLESGGGCATINNAILPFDFLSNSLIEVDNEDIIEGAKRILNDTEEVSQNDEN